MNKSGLLAAAVLAAACVGTAGAQNQQPRLPNAEVQPLVRATEVEITTNRPTQPWRSWLGAAARALAAMTAAKNAGDMDELDRQARAYDQAIDRAYEAANRAGDDRETALTLVGSGIQRHYAVLKGLLKKVPEAAPEIRIAMNASVNGHDEALSAIQAQQLAVAGSVGRVTDTSTRSVIVPGVNNIPGVPPLTSATTQPGVDGQRAPSLTRPAPPARTTVVATPATAVVPTGDGDTTVVVPGGGVGSFVNPGFIGPNTVVPGGVTTAPGQVLPGGVVAPNGQIVPGLNPQAIGPFTGGGAGGRLPIPGTTGIQTGSPLRGLGTGPIVPAGGGIINPGATIRPGVAPIVPR